MSEITLAIGNKNYSSWSLRAWLALRHCGVPFREDRIALDQLDTAARIRAYSPAGRVPVLVDGDITVWDTLAICEYLAERFPQAQLWPQGLAARAHARAISAEMHAGFRALRTELPMNIRAMRRVEVGSAALADIERIADVWEYCRATYGATGGWLFGSFTIADAMYAPVVLRLHTYGIPVSRPVDAYVSHVLSDPALADWIAAAKQETEVIDGDERGEAAA